MQSFIGLASMVPEIMGGGGGGLKTHSWTFKLNCKKTRLNRVKGNYKT